MRTDAPRRAAVVISNEKNVFTQVGFENALAANTPTFARFRDSAQTIDGKGKAWPISDSGAAAVLLKMDEAQGRLGTPGALVRRGDKAEASVPAALPVPVIVRGTLVASLARGQTLDEARAALLARAAKAPGSHNEKRLRNILENYPRDELFQIAESELLTIALGILHLHDRPRIKSFTRKDPFDRFVSVLTFIPRERFNPGVRERIGRILANAWGGRLSAWYPQLSDQPLVRIHYIIGVTPGDHPCPDQVALDLQITEAGRSWVDRFESALRDADVDDVAVGPLSAKWAEAFGAGYRDRYDAAEAVRAYEEMLPANA